MTELFAFPDIEAELVGWLTALLAEMDDSAVVGTKVPNPLPQRLVRLVRAGGAQRNLVTDAPRVVFECWDGDEVAAAQLARTVRALLWAAAPGRIGAIWCNKIVDAGLVPSPDPDTGTPRYLITAELHVSGVPL
ncbi:hypothetical protein [Nocardia sp. CY41]|uniref:hypothetical protein n=1 Tax=Nocardia sp. CY41 TaxID=2608686 RepID=UPI00135C5088|nr:hypothetical protein [Nocardia sp. CY41]